MSDMELSTSSQDQSLAKGLLAGLIAGLVATAAKSFAEKIYPPQAHGEQEPSAILPSRVSDGSSKMADIETIHWTFGALAGAAYGALAEYYPAATAKDGASFGLALATLTQETALPAMGLSGDSEAQTARERVGEMGTHMIFGLVTETVRRTVRKFL